MENNIMKELESLLAEKEFYENVNDDCNTMYKSLQELQDRKCRITLVIKSDSGNESSIALSETKMLLNREIATKILLMLYEHYSAKIREIRAKIEQVCDALLE